MSLGNSPIFCGMGYAVSGFSTQLFRGIRCGWGGGGGGFPLTLSPRKGGDQIRADVGHLFLDLGALTLLRRMLSTQKSWLPRDHEVVFSGGGGILDMQRCSLGGLEEACDPHLPLWSTHHFLAHRKSHVSDVLDFGKWTG